MLHDLRLRLCRRTGLSCAALASVVLSSHALTRLEWTDFPALRSVQLDCPYLEELAFDECAALQDAVFEGMSDSALATLAGAGGSVSVARADGCPALRVLRVQSCDALRHLALRHSHVARLALQDCRSLASVRLSCPALSELTIEGCGELEAVSLRPIGVTRRAPRARARRRERAAS